MKKSPKREMARLDELDARFENLAQSPVFAECQAFFKDIQQGIRDQRAQEAQKIGKKR